MNQFLIFSVEDANYICNDRQEGGVMEGVGGLCWSPTGSLMKWSDFLVCSSQLLPLQSQDIWPRLFVLLRPPYLQMTEWTRKNKSKASAVSFPPTAWEWKRLSICSLPYSVMRAKNQNAMKVVLQKVEAKNIVVSDLPIITLYFPSQSFVLVIDLIPVVCLSIYQSIPLNKSHFNNHRYLWWRATL